MHPSTRSLVSEPKGTKALSRSVFPGFQHTYCKTVTFLRASPGPQNALEESQRQLKSFNLLVLFPSGSLMRTKDPNSPNIFSKFAKETEGRALAEGKKKCVDRYNRHT